MNTEKFTAGPWNVITNIHKNGKYFCYRLDGEDTTLLQTEANSKLMEAAPDMYEALKELRVKTLVLMDDIDENDAREMESYQDLLTTIDKATAALAKANPQSV